MNNSPRLNGKLSVIYDDLAYTLGNIYSDYQNYQMGFEHLEEGNTNFTYIYANNDTKKVVTNKTSYENYAELEKNVRNLISEKDVKYMVIYPKLKDFNSNMNVSKSDKWENSAVTAVKRNGTAYLRLRWIQLIRSRISFIRIR